MSHLLTSRIKEIGIFMLCLMMVKIIASLWQMDDYIDFFGSVLGAIFAAGILSIPIVAIVVVINWLRLKLS